MAKVLVSAYACEPNKGSEPEVGWQWLRQIAKNNEVWVLTKENNVDTISKYIESNQNTIYSKVHFIYVKLPKVLTFWKKGNRGMRLYYLMWAREALKLAKKLHKKNNFELVHSVTFVSYTQPCYLYKLGIPFVWTVAGGENIPHVINYPMRFKEKLYEFVRRLGQKKPLFSHSTRSALERCDALLVTTKETLEKIPSKYHNKAIVTSAIGIEKEQIQKEYKVNDPLKILLSGKFVYLKGVDIGLKAILKVLEKGYNVRFEILGNGPCRLEYLELCKKYVGEKIVFVERVPHEEMINYYKKFDFLINTALRDSGCLVVMEAMSVGLPCVCIDTGGVKEMTTDDTSIKVRPAVYSELVNDMADAIEKMICDSEMRITLGNNSYERINAFYLYDKKGEQLEKIYRHVLLRK